MDLQRTTNSVLVCLSKRDNRSIQDYNLVTDLPNLRL